MLWIFAVLVLVLFNKGVVVVVVVVLVLGCSSGGWCRCQEAEKITITRRV